MSSIPATPICSDTVPSDFEYVGQRLAGTSSSALSIMKTDLTADFNRAVQSVRKNGFTGGRAEYRDLLEFIVSQIDNELARRDRLAGVRR